jgi:lipopolysaccharide export system protein LptC
MALDPKELSLREVETPPSRLRHLDPLTGKRGRISGEYYSRFVRFMRLFLPLVAVCIIGMVMLWPSLENSFAPIPKQAVLPQTLGKNELLNPRFKSKDDRQQPFTITAKRAIQSAKDQEVIILEKPEADITLKNGTWLAVESKRGIYRQNDEKLLLEGGVQLFHDQGYQMETEKLLISLKTRDAWSDAPVSGQGPAGSLQAKGMRAQTDKGLMVFDGPVKLVLNREIKGL